MLEKYGACDIFGYVYLLEGEEWEEQLHDYRQQQRRELEKTFKGTGP